MLRLVWETDDHAAKKRRMKRGPGPSSPKVERWKKSRSLSGFFLEKPSSYQQ